MNISATHINYILLTALAVILSVIGGCKEDTKQHSLLDKGTFVIEGDDQVSIAYTVHGASSEKNPLVLVHGWSCDQSYWEKQVKRFERDRQIVTIDLAGHGGSSQGNRTNFSIESFANDVNTVIKHIKLKDYVLMGHSMGSIVVLRAIDDYGEDAAAVVAVDYLFDTLRPLPPEQFAGMIAPFEADFATVTKQFVSKGMFDSDSDSTIVQRISADMASAPKDVAISAIGSLIQTDHTSLLQDIGHLDLQKHIINADKNLTNKVYLSEGLGFDIHIVPESNHFFMIEKPVVTNDIIEKITQDLL